jgi:hypothetical protein
MFQALSFFFLLLESNSVHLKDAPNRLQNTQLAVIILKR